MAAKYFGPRPLTIPQQVGRMRAHFPQLVCAWRGERATWIGMIQPTSLASEYKIRIDYSLRKAPKVSVLHPQLEHRADGTPIPHVYPGDHPCLYLPGCGEWDPTMAIAGTIVPWTSLWLFFYETWHATGDWMGGGVHPATKDAP
jgi:hypothetical protein